MCALACHHLNDSCPHVSHTGSCSQITIAVNVTEINESEKANAILKSVNNGSKEERRMVTHIDYYPPPPPNQPARASLVPLVRIVALECGGRGESG